MTLVQACIANKGNSVVLLADRLLTTHLSEDLPPYEFEAKKPKIFFNESVGIGFAGSSLHADVAQSKILDKTDFDEISNIITEYLYNKRKDNIDKTIKRLTGVESDRFFTECELPIPPEIRGMIYTEMKDYSLNCQSMVTGFDKKKNARIIITDDYGGMTDTTNFGFFAIGSGSPFSRVYFDQYGYSIDMDTKEAVLFAFEAKKWAQAHTGVGDNTDIIVFIKDKKEIKVEPIYDNSDLMKRLKDTYTAEIQKKKDLRDKLIKDLFKDGDGI